MEESLPEDAALPELDNEDAPHVPIMERFGAIIAAPVGQPLTQDDQEACAFILSILNQMYRDNYDFEQALLDIAYERDDINGKGRMQRRAARALAAHEGRQAEPAEETTAVSEGTQ